MSASASRQDRLLDMKLPAGDLWIVLARPEGENAYQGVVEQSWAMALNADRACVMDEEDALHHQEHYARRIKGEVKAWNVRDPAIPVLLHWNQWREDNVQQPSGRIRSKYRARNAIFYEKE